MFLEPESFGYPFPFGGVGKTGALSHDYQPLDFKWNVLLKVTIT